MDEPLTGATGVLDGLTGATGVEETLAELLETG